MAKINLLPWREERRRQLNNEFYILIVITLAISGMVAFYVHLHFTSLIDSQIERNNYLKNEIKLVDKKISEIKDLEKTKKGLLARMDVIQQLQRSRPEIVKLFDQLVQTIPEGVYLKSIALSGTSLELQGLAKSQTRVSTYMNLLNASESFDKPDLIIIQKEPTEGGELLVSFTLKVQQVVKKAITGDEEEEE